MPGRVHIVLTDEAVRQQLGDDASLVGDLAPGCTATNNLGEPTGQALPPVRMREVCESLDVGDGTGANLRCCMESVCAPDLGPAFGCLTGVLLELAGQRG